MTIVFAAVVTKDLLREYQLFRRSFRIYHGFDPISVVHCDAVTYDVIRGMPCTTALPTVGTVDRPVSQWSSEFRAVVRHKMLAVANAWRLHSPAAVAYIDVDTVVTAPFFWTFDDFPTPLTLSPHFWGAEAERRSSVYGYYNAGLILIRDPRFADWWLSAFDAQPESFCDQACLNEAPGIFETSHFPEPWNVGYWRRRSETDVPPVSLDTITFHAHVFAPSRDVNPFEVGQKAFVDTALDMLKCRDTARDRELLRTISDLERSGAGSTVRGSITQNYRRPLAAECSCSVSPMIRSIRRGGPGSGAGIYSCSTSAAISSARAGTSTI
jgi:hypothetical protein